MNEYIYDILENFNVIVYTGEECGLLVELVKAIKSDSLSESDLDPDSDDVEKLFFKEVMDNEFDPSFTLNEMNTYAREAHLTWKVAEDSDWFVFYLFHRRYGWPDLRDNDGFLNVCVPDALAKFRKSEKSVEIKYKSALVDILEILISWVYNQPISLKMVRMFTSCIRLAYHTPVTRNQLAVHTIDWLKERLVEPSPELFEAVKSFLILCITDYWSQIRSACITRLSQLIEKCSLEDIQSLFEDLTKLCDQSTNTWQATDGAIGAINVIIKRFQKVGFNLDVSQNDAVSVSPRVKSQIKLGSHFLDKLPTYISHKMKSLIFKLVTNPQLTIRETAVKAFVSCVSRCSEQEIELAFHDVYQRLQYKSQSVSTSDFNRLDYGSSVLTENFKFMDPYTAESLLHLCLLLFKQISDHQSYLENWDVYQRTFDIYLMHPASSVRLAASSLFKYIVSRSIDSPLLVKNILCCLIRKWYPRQTVLLTPILNIAKEAEAPCRRPSITDERGSLKDESVTWEWREGRLLVYELVCEFLIKNHHLYTFGPPSISVRGSLNVASFGRHQTSINSNPTPEANVSLHGEQGDDDIDDVFHLDEAKESRGTSSMSSYFKKKRNPSGGGLIKHKVLKSQLSSSLSTSDSALNVDEYGRQLSARRKSQEIYRVPKESLRPRLSTIDGLTTTFGSRFRPAFDKNQYDTHFRGKYTAFLVHVKIVEKAEEEATKTDDLCDYRLPSFRSIICQMLHTCFESMADSQWELRRISKQAFSCIGEVLRWFDPSLLADLITTHLVCEPTLMTFCCLNLLKDTLQHAARLKVLVSNPPSIWQYDVALGAICCILDAVKNNLTLWLRSCHYYLQRDQFDCITPVTVHVILLTVLNFSEAQKDESCHLQCLVDAFTRLDSIMQDKQSNIKILPYEIYPSLTMVPSIGCSPIEYCCFFIEEIRGLLPIVFQSVEDVVSVVPLLPVMTRWVGHFSQLRTNTSESIKGLISSLTALTNQIVRKITEDRRIVAKVEHLVEETVNIIAQLVSDKQNLTFWWVKHLIDLVTTLLNVISVDMSPLVMALVPRLRSHDNNNSSVKSHPHDQNDAPRVILTNSFADEAEIVEEDPDEKSVSSVSDISSHKKRLPVLQQNRDNLQLLASQAYTESVENLDKASSVNSDLDGEEEPLGYPESLALERHTVSNSYCTRSLTNRSLSLGPDRASDHLSDWDSDTDSESREDEVSLTAQKFLNKLSDCRRDLFLDSQRNLDDSDVAILRSLRCSDS